MAPLRVVADVFVILPRDSRQYTWEKAKFHARRLRRMCQLSRVSDPISADESNSHHRKK
jgi:hypothetical protein